MKRITFLVLFGLLFSLNSYAFKFSPMSTTIGVTPSSSSSLFYLENDTDQPIAVQVSLMNRVMDLSGVETNTKIGSELILYPSQLIIPANEKRSVKVTWSGAGIPEKELAYRLIAEQLPIELDKKKNQKASIKVLLKYVAAVYVSDDSYSSEAAIEEVKIQDKKVFITINNTGKKHQVLTNLNLKFINEKTKKEILIQATELKGMTGENILANSKRQFVFSATGKFSEISSSDKVKISFEKN